MVASNAARIVWSRSAGASGGMAKGRAMASGATASLMIWRCFGRISSAHLDLLVLIRIKEALN